MTLKKMVDATVKIAGPIVLAAIMHKLATGKLDIKGAALDVAEGAVRDARAVKAAK